MIFDEIHRTDGTPKLSIESDFQFLNRCSRKEMELARQFLEDMIAHYPEKDDLISRIRSGNNNNYRSAEFELLLFSTLRKTGYSLTPHPALPNGSSSRPDFLVTSPGGEEFYLEAVLASEDNDDASNDPLLATTLDVFTSKAHQNFGVIVKTSGYPKTQPSRKNLLRTTMEWLDSLNPDSVQSLVDANGHDALPTLVWSHESLEIFIQAIPLRADRRGKASRLLAAQFGQAGWIDNWSPIKNAIRRKGSKYGLLDKPLVVAVNFQGLHLDRMDEMQALFGQEQIMLSVNDPDAEPRLTRKPNGAWTGPGGAQFTRISGAWIFDNLCTYNISSRNPTLYFNPWAQIPIPNEMLQFGHAIGVDGHMSWREGVPLDAIFGLPKNWPREC
jgi:hypothetical protein